MYHNGNAHIKHINPACTLRFHHPCDNSQGISSYRENPASFTRSSVDTGITYAGIKSTTRVTGYSMESIVRRPTPVKMVDQPMDQSGSSTAQTQAQPVTLVSFASTTQVRMDTVVPPTVSQVPPRSHLYGCPFCKSQV